MEVENNECRRAMSSQIGTYYTTGMTNIVLVTAVLMSLLYIDQVRVYPSLIHENVEEFRLI